MSGVLKNAVERDTTTRAPLTKTPVPAPVAPAATESVADQHEFLSRDLTWLEFNRRVLHEALDDRTPLLERVRFLGIVTSNLDEYFMKRVGGLKRQIAAGVVSQSLDGMTPAQTLDAIRRTVLPMLTQQADCFTKEVRPALAENGVHLLDWDELTDAERKSCTLYFRANVFPVLTPLAVDPGIPFPFISNLSTSLGVILHHPDRHENLFARVKVPEVLPKWIPVTGGPPGGQRFVSLLTLIRDNLGDLFPDMAVVDVMVFRVTRNADLERDEEEAEDLLEMMEEEVRQRRFARVIRLEHGSHSNQWMLEFLMRELELTPGDLYEMSAELDYDDLRPIADLNLPRLRYEPWSPMVPAAFADEDADVFNVIRNSDILVHLPYESFAASVERFVEAATADPRVLAIKMTLYRTGDASPFISTLIRAAEAGKQVVCLVELKARFDEARNIHLAAALEKAGVHVVYGIVGLKTHTKTTLVVRQDSRRNSLLCSRRHRQLPRRNGQVLYRPGPLHLRSGNHPRRDRAIPLSDRPLPEAGLPQAPGGAGQHAESFSGADRTGGDACEGRPPCTDHRQDEQPRRPEDLSRPLPGLAGRREDRSDRPWFLCPAPAGAGIE